MGITELSTGAAESLIGSRFLHGVGRAALRFPWLTLAVVSVIVLVVQIPQPHATAWHFFDDAAGLLLGEEGGGLHLYAGRPDLQFGPLSIVVALPFTALGAHGDWAAMIAFSALGIAVLGLLFDALLRLRPAIDRRAGGPALLSAGVLLLVVWGDVSVRTTHIDDAITLTGIAAAIWAIARGRPWWVVAALAVAGAAKPWGLILAPLAAALPGRWRWARVAAVLALAALTWAPFVIAEPLTLDVSGFGIINEASSSLRALGVSDAMTPDWVRPAQLVGGLVIATALVWRGRWATVVMAGVAFRLLVDPAANRYYTVGVVLGLLVYELLRKPERFPWLTVIAAAALEFGQHPWFPATLSGWTRLLVTAGVIILAFVSAPPRARARPAVTPQEGSVMRSTSE